ncbi:DUF5615 family PIN-like protein, partial [bacterium]|nr:DUF5615 family PIN-like protein [bacterium]
MKFVIDENVSYGLAEALRTSGHQVTAISGGMKDMSLFDMVGKETVLITRDHHFTNPLRFAP